MSNEVMFLLAQRPNKALFRRGEQTVKLFDGTVCAADVLNEALNQARVQETGLPVPRLHEVTKHDDGRWAIISDYIEGQTLLQCMEEQPERLEEWMALLVRLQMEVHSKRAPLLGRMKDKLNRKISACGLDATSRYELHTRLETMPAHAKVCHGDFNPSNVILREGKPFLIDWAHVTQGNAAADAANSYLTFLRLGMEDKAQLYLKLYCEQSDTARQYLEKWIPIVAAARLSGAAPESRGFWARWCEGITE
ncbi:MAG: phosphotransferase [Oscillospiraceae bacterium]|nr:phosphotransferase [Oscillospiraceae bacterium]